MPLQGREALGGSSVELETWVWCQRNAKAKHSHECLLPELRVAPLPRSDRSSGAGYTEGHPFGKWGGETMTTDG